MGKNGQRVWKGNLGNSNDQHTWEDAKITNSEIHTTMWYYLSCIIFYLPRKRKGKIVLLWWERYGGKDCFNKMQALNLNYQNPLEKLFNKTIKF